nr:eukaryotic translation initiation factor 2 subunit beta [Quercus suber]
MISQMMHRDPAKIHKLHRVEHVMTFLPSEIGTSGSLGGQPQLVVWSRFAPKSFEGILQRCIILKCSNSYQQPLFPWGFKLAC